MKQTENPACGEELALWGGLECTVNRVADEYFSQLERNGHHERISDLERFARLGISAIRYPVLWEHMAPKEADQIDWHWSDERLPALQDLGITPIVGLVHHGSGPKYTSLTDLEFPEKLATFAIAVANRYPWLEYYTPVNEPLTTARFSGLYGVWYPHGRDDRIFIEALLNQCRAVALSMREIRKVNPQAKLVQTDDLGKTYSTAQMSGLADFYNSRRWLGWISCAEKWERSILYGSISSAPVFLPRGSYGSGTTRAHPISSASTITLPASAGWMNGWSDIPAITSRTIGVSALSMSSLRVCSRHPHRG